MAKTYSRLITHVTFSTRFRRPILEPAFEKELYGYIGATLNGFGGQTITVNGYRDHVHLLFHYPPTIAISKLIAEVKKSSTSWVQESLRRPTFRWQEGFGAFSEHHRDHGRIVKYIQNQREHHRAKSFQEEYETLLREHGIEFDPRYHLESEVVT